MIGLRTNFKQVLVNKTIYVQMCNCVYGKIEIFLVEASPHQSQDEESSCRAAYQHAGDLAPASFRRNQGSLAAR